MTTSLELLPHGESVVGLGVDICEVSRIAGVYARHGVRFLERVFLPGEVRRAPSSPTFAEHVAPTPSALVNRSCWKCLF